MNSIEHDKNLLVIEAIEGFAYSKFRGKYKFC